MGVFVKAIGIFVTLVVLLAGILYVAGAKSDADEAVRKHHHLLAIALHHNCTEYPKTAAQAAGDCPSSDWDELTPEQQDQAS
jgi:hypothetical protein